MTKYFPSQVSRLIEVDNLNATMNINAENITYGDVAIINIVLNNDATGNVTVSIDGVSNTSSVVGGIAQVLIYGVVQGDGLGLADIGPDDDAAPARGGAQGAQAAGGLVGPGVVEAHPVAQGAGGDFSRKWLSYHLSLIEFTT